MQDPKTCQKDPLRDPLRSSSKSDLKSCQQEYRRSKWLLYGSQGWIASYFKKCVEKESDIEMVEGKSRCDDFSSLQQEIISSRPDRVISFIGRTSAPSKEIANIKDTSSSTIDFLEKPGNLRINLRDNLYSPFLLEKICTKYDIHFTYLGTGCIFSYDDKDAKIPVQKENDAPNFFGSSYSTVKGFTDMWMQLSTSTLNVRIRMPIVKEHSLKNFITKILSYDRIHSCLNSMTVLEDLLPVLVDLIKKRKVGTCHLVNPGPMTHNEILELYREIVDPNFIWINMTQEDISKTLLSKRSKCVLDTTTLSREYHIPTLRESLRKMFTAMVKL